MAMQAAWRDGVFAEIAHWPAGLRTPLNGPMTSRRPSDRAHQADRAVRAACSGTGLSGGETIIVQTARPAISAPAR